MEIMEIITSIDFVIFIIVGAVIGGLAGEVMKAKGSILNIVISIVGSVISGFIFDWLNFMDIGDYADPIIAGAVGSVIFLAIVWVIRGKEKPPETNPQK